MATKGRPKKAKEFVLKPGIPKPPNYVQADGDAWQEWIRVCELLDREKRISELFLASLATYCMKYADWVYARKKIQDDGRGKQMVGPNGQKREVRNPWLNYEHECFRELQKAASEIGITPLTSMKVEAIPQGNRQPGQTPAEQESESLDSFIAGAGS